MKKSANQNIGQTYTLYSIGHGNKGVDKLIDELKAFEINYLIDVRSKPFSKFNPQFNQSSLKIDLMHHQIKYVFLGDQLGGLPEDETCYVDGKADYNRIKEREFFQSGLKRLITASKKGIRVAIMCSETRPEQCHRSKLIGQELLKLHVLMKHILSEKIVKDQITVMNEVHKGKNAVDLFGEENSLTSRKSYL